MRKNWKDGQMGISGVFHPSTSFYSSKTLHFTMEETKFTSRNILIKIHQFENLIT